MITLIELIVLITILSYVAKIHIQINKKDRTRSVPVATSVIRESSSEKIAEQPILTTTPQTSIPTEEVPEEKIEVQDVVSKEILKDTVETSREIVTEGQIFKISEERLSSLDRDPEESEILHSVVELEKSLSDKEEISLEQAPIDYGNVLSQEYKHQVCENIVEAEEHKWYEKAIGGGSIVKIQSKDNYQVEEYTF